MSAVGVKAEGKTLHLQEHVEWFETLDENNLSIETLEREEVKAYHERAVNKLIHYLYENNSFYRAKLEEAGITSASHVDFEEFSKIPFLTKDELREDSKVILTKKKLAQLCCSTGTTGGKPIYIGHTLDELYSYYFAPKYPSLMERVKNKVVANALPYEMSSSALTFHHEFQHLLNCTILPLGKGGAYSEPKKAIEFMQAWEAEVLVTTPTYAIVLWEAAQEMNIDLTKDLKVSHIFLTGEGSSNSFRKRIELIWGCTSTILYGSLEAMLMGLECDSQSGFHLPDGHLYVEIVDPETNELLDPGQQGEIVITTLLREGMPLLRYRTGDLGFIEESGCACGINLPKLHLRGRSGDQIVLPAGSFSPFYLEDILMQVEGVGNWYRFLVKGNSLTVEVEPFNDEVDKEYLAQLIEEKLEFYTNSPCTARVVEKVQRNDGKIKRVWYID